MEKKMEIIDKVEKRRKNEKNGMDVDSENSSGDYNNIILKKDKDDNYELID